MAEQLIRQDKLRKPDDFDDQLSGVQVATIEGDSESLEIFWNGILSQFKRVLHGDDPGNWHDNPMDLEGHVATLRQLALGDHLSRIPLGNVEIIREDRQLLHCGNFIVEGELIVNGEWCLG